MLSLKQLFCLGIDTGQIVEAPLKCVLVYSPLYKFPIFLGSLYGIYILMTIVDFGYQKPSIPMDDILSVIFLHSRRWIKTDKRRCKLDTNSLFSTRFNILTTYCGVLTWITLTLSVTIRQKNRNSYYLILTIVKNCEQFFKEIQRLRSLQARWQQFGIITQLVRRPS